MVVKVGNTYVTEAAYAQAKKKIENEQSAGSGETNSKDNYLASLQKRFQSSNISTNTQPYSGKGINNIAISPNILGEMARDPEKRLEYEALIIDCQSASKSLASDFKQRGIKLIGHGFIIGSDGELSSWAMAQSGDSDKKSTFSYLPKENKKSWQGIILDSLTKNKTDRKYNSSLDIKA